MLLAAATVIALAQRQAALAARDEAVRRLYALQLSRAGEIANEDPGRGLELLDDAERAAPALRDFTWKLVSRLNTRHVLALGGLRNHRQETGKIAAPVLALSDDGTLLATSSVRSDKVWSLSPERL